MNCTMLDEYAMYLRKSRADEERERIEKFDTLKKHERTLKELSVRGGYPVVKVFRELVSGESISARVEFQALMEEVAARKYKGVLVHAVDRLGRGDMMEYGWILSTFQYTGTLIITPYKVFDPRDDMDMQQLQMQMFFSNNELSIIKRRMREGKERAASDGCYIGAIAPFGYDKVAIGKDKTLIPNDKSPIVERIYREIASGKSPSALARELNASGIRTTLGKDWSPARITSLVSNPLYKGYVTWNKTVLTIDSRDGMDYVKRRVKGSNPIIERGLHEPIVSEELWEAANAAIRPSSKLKKAHKLKNPLAGVLRCAKCGRAMSLTIQKANGSKYGYYRHAPYTTCECESSRMSDIIDVAVSALKQVAADIELRLQYGDDETETHEKELEALYREQKANSKKLDKLVELYTADALTLLEFRSRRDELDMRTDQLEKRIASLVEYVPPDPQEIIVSLKEAIEALADEEIECETRNAALKAIVSSIEYEKIDGIISLNISLRDI